VVPLLSKIISGKKFPVLTASDLKKDTGRKGIWCNSLTDSGSVRKRFAKFLYSGFPKYWYLKTSRALVLNSFGNPAKILSY
jgi:hypothetical protein